MSRSTNRQGSIAEPEVWFRIVHLSQSAKNRPLLAPYPDQTAYPGPN
jgi:hypothetical protein